MQTLYTVATLEQDAKALDPKKILQQHFDQTRSLLIYLTWLTTEVARYAETDSHQRASKHLPSTEDLHVNTKIAGNELLWKILDDQSLKDQLKVEKPELIANREFIRKIYHSLVDTQEYRNYISRGARDKSEEKKIMEFILNDLILANEAVVSDIEEHFSNWDDDGEMVVAGRRSVV